MSFVGTEEVNVGVLKNFLLSLPASMDNVPVKFVMGYSFTNWIDSIQSGHSGGGPIVKWAARRLLDHMKENSKWRADLQTAIVVRRRDGRLELRFGNTCEPMSLWWEEPPEELTQLQLFEPPKPEHPKNAGPSIRSRWQTPRKLGPDESSGIVLR